MARIYLCRIDKIKEGSSYSTTLKEVGSVQGIKIRTMEGICTSGVLFLSTKEILVN